MIAIIDYGMGNLLNVQKALLKCKACAQITSSGSQIKKSQKIIFPGVGHFGKAVRELKKRKLFDLVKGCLKDGIPFLGICVGMQLLMQESQEAPGIKGLGVIEGKVQKFNDKKLIVPHMGWNQVRPIATKQALSASDNILQNIKPDSYFYFAHSYYCVPENKADIAAVSGYGINFASVLHRNNVWAVQFHPEKSQSLGLKVLANFLKL
jgi:glutamine amidotransferase